MHLKNRVSSYLSGVSACDLKAGSTATLGEACQRRATTAEGCKVAVGEN